MLRIHVYLGRFFQLWKFGSNEALDLPTSHPTFPLLHPYFTPTSPLLHPYVAPTSLLLHLYFTNTSPAAPESWHVREMPHKGNTGKMKKRNDSSDNNSSLCCLFLFIVFYFPNTEHSLTHAAYMPAGEKGWQPNASANQEGGPPSASALMEKLAIDYMVAYRTQGCQPLGKRRC